MIKLSVACVIALLSGAAAQSLTSTAVAEHQLYEDIEQPALSTNYYSTQVTRDFYEPGKQLVFRVIADSFGSDPDIYISRTEPFPNSPATSDWYCAKKGSETCIVEDGDFAVSDTLYFGITCLDECKYKLKIWYAEVLDLSQSERQQIRFDAYSTYIMSLNVPATVNGQRTGSLEVRLEAEKEYNQMDLWLSLDDHFQIVEERPAAHLTPTTIGLKFNSQDYQWCTDCTVYAIFSVEEEDRYYVTSIARTENDVLQGGLKATVYVNPFQQDCYRYFVLRTQATVRIEVESYGGLADLYVSSRNLPTGPDSDSIELRAAQGPNRALVLTASDRMEFDATTGAYYICMWADTDFSASILVNEYIPYQSQYASNADIAEDVVTTQLLQKNGGAVFNRFTSSAIAQERTGKITVYTEYQGLEAGQSAPDVYYNVCLDTADNCQFDPDTALTAVGADAFTRFSGGIVTNSGKMTYEIEHDPSVCGGDVDKCTYVFGVVNELPQDLRMTQIVHTAFDDPGNIFLSRSYKNAIPMGTYFSYELNPTFGSNADTMPFIKELTINLRALRGDADIFASLVEQAPKANNAEYHSRKNLQFDQIIIQNGPKQDIFSQPVYFSVFARSYVQYEITFEYVLNPNFNELLYTAFQLGEGIPKVEVLEDEYEERLYSYAPWWSGRENRTAVFLADVIANNVFFYSQWNEYPKHYATSRHDQEDTITYYGSAEDARQNGTFYARLRPEFALADLLSRRQYVYNMYAFSMAPASTHEQTGGFVYDTLELGKPLVGHIEPNLYQDYRYFVMDQQADFQINLKRIPGRGSPKFFVKYIGTDDGIPARNNRYDQASEDVDGQFHTQQVNATRTDRDDANFKCGTVFHSQQPTGKQDCFIAISVTCDNKEDSCSYELQVDPVDKDFNVLEVPQLDFESANRPDFVPQPPGPIITQEYTNGRLEGENSIAYYYFPIDYASVGLPMIILNKTKLSGQETNGDTYLIANIQPNVTTEHNLGYDYTTWNYPTITNFHWGSKTNDPDSPEILEACFAGMVEQCGTEGNGCALIVGVVAADDLPADYRLRGFYGQDQLKVDEAIHVPATEYYEGQTEKWTYHWFIITDSIGDAAAEWNYYIATGSALADGNPDLYVALYDGRYPSEVDWDAASTKDGAGAVAISSRDSIWAEKGWDITAGVVVVVGIHETRPTDYNVVMTKKPAADTPLGSIKQLQISQQYSSESFPAIDADEREYSEYFMYYNWFHRDFQISLSMPRGDGVLSVGKTGQLDTSNNLFSAMPYNEANSLTVAEVSSGQSKSIMISGDACYSCWYLIRVDLTSPTSTSFRLQATQQTNNDQAWGEIQISNSAEFFIRANEQTQAKFTLDSMENWQLEGDVSTGDVTIYIGLNPEKLQELANGEDSSLYLWSTSASAGETASITVRQTDPDFHLGATYFVYLVSTSSTNVIINLELKQQRVAHFLANNNDYTYQLQHPLFNFYSIKQKFTFMTTKELVKFHAFQVQGGKSEAVSYHKVQIIFESLSPDLYPMIYLRQVTTSEEATNLQELTYPSRINKDRAFGENPYSQLGQTTQIYEFYGATASEYTYYTMSIYQENWGLTDELKSDYQVMVAVEVATAAEAGEDAIAQVSGAVSSVKEAKETAEVSRVITAETNDEGWMFVQS